MTPFREAIPHNVIKAIRVATERTFSVMKIATILPIRARGSAVRT